MRSFEKKHLEQLRPYLPECMVMLKSNGAFPLEKPCSIAAFGNGVRDTVKGGTGSGEVNSRYFISIENGLERAGFKIVNKEWSSKYSVFLKKAKEDLNASIKRKAKEQKINVIAASMGAVLKQPEYEIELNYLAGAAIYVVARLSGEGNDRLAEKGDFQLTDSEVRDILALNSGYEKFMLIINAGGPVDLSRVSEVGNILVMSQLGVEAGSAVADVLLGKSYPSGKLTTTWASYEDYCHVGDFGERDDTRYREGIYVGYRYFDSADKKPLFPFGYGVGYTTFAVSDYSGACLGTTVTAEASVSNTGSFRGKETVQFYVACPSENLVREAKSLAGFVKTRELKPGESETVTACFDIKDFAAYDTENARYILEPGRYVILGGTDSMSAEPFAYFDIEETVVTRLVKNMYGKPDFEDAVFEERREYETEGLQVLTPDFSLFRTEEVTYEDKTPEMPEVSALSDEELAYLNIGAFDPKGGLMSVIGNASQSVAGAAGESTLQLKAKGIGNLIMADGPAGLRLARQFYRDKKGVHAVGSTMPESILEMLPAPVKWFMTRKPKLKNGVVLQEQFATALPIATAIAQSFNTEFAEMCGDIVGSEMEEYGVDLWLAPALNIHRNVLCGRNFEYYSEDPLVSGKMAAAVTRGVQKHSGRGVTIKHYAANNQETNRYANNSMVSERALREIYLRGFEICVKESAPRSVMTSYNLLNGTHTSESRDLTDIMRNEFGFTGIIMTDWVIGGNLLTGETKYRAPDPALVAAAGCSLFMPGSKKDYEALLDGLANGRVTREQLESNAAYLINDIRKNKESKHIKE